MKVKLPVMIQDPWAAPRKGVDMSENYEFEGEAFWLDGPVTERVAVLDFDEKGGKLVPAAEFDAPRGKGWGGYKVTPPVGIQEMTREFNQVSVLATILKTMSLAEGEWVLGRRVEWAFDAPQLLVVPRAGEWANAFYERDTHSLQFFYFKAQDSDELVYTSLSRDIVSHETAHAILDGIAPGLYDALTPEALALHEAFADMTAVLMAVYSKELALAVLDQTHGRLDFSTAFSRIAEQFGRERHGSTSLRDLSKVTRMQDVPGVEPHELSVVLSSALYETFQAIFAAHKERLIKAKGDRFGDPSFSVSGEALAVAAGQCARMLYRALDYLPLGEITFADYGRAILAADAVAFPKGGAIRDALRRALVKRQIVPGEAALSVRTDWDAPLKRPVDLDDLVDSDWVAYQFANDHRVLLAIPEEVKSFRVHPRLRTEKRISKTGPKVEDIVFRVSWDHIEENRAGRGLPFRRRITAGTTLVINADQSHTAEEEPGSGIVDMAQTSKMSAAQSYDYEQRPRRLRIAGAGKDRLRVRARLTSDLGESQRKARDAMLAHLVDEGLVELDEQAVGPDGKPRAAVVYAQTRNQVLKLRGTSRMLHITSR